MKGPYEIPTPSGIILNAVSSAIQTYTDFGFKPSEEVGIENIESGLKTMVLMLTPEIKTELENKLANAEKNSQGHCGPCPLTNPTGSSWNNNEEECNKCTYTYKGKPYICRYSQLKKRCIRPWITLKSYNNNLKNTTVKNAVRISNTTYLRNKATMARDKRVKK